MSSTRTQHAFFRSTCAGLAAAVLTFGPSQPASAAVWTPHTVSTVTDGGWIPTALAKEHEQAGGLEYWGYFRIGEIRSTTAIPSNLICGYQAGISWQSPDGSVTYQTQYSKYPRLVLLGGVV